MNMTEPKRILENLRGERPPPVWICFRSTCREPALVAKRVGSISRMFAERRASENWPATEWWTERLPDWLRDSFGVHSAEEIKNNINLWALDAWVAAMRAPGWEWWSSECAIDKFVVN